MKPSARQPSLTYTSEAREGIYATIAGLERYAKTFDPEDIRIPEIAQEIVDQVGTVIHYIDNPQEFNEFVTRIQNYRATSKVFSEACKTVFSEETPTPEQLWMYYQSSNGPTIDVSVHSSSPFWKKAVAVSFAVLACSPAVAVLGSVMQPHLLYAPLEDECDTSVSMTADDDCLPHPLPRGTHDLQ